MSLKTAWEKVRGTYGPIQVNLEPTIRCNLKCRMCDRTEKSKYLEYQNNELKTQIIFNLIRDLEIMGTKQILIAGGGEPLMRKDICQIITKIKESRIYLHLWTNGTLITRTNFKFLADNIDMLTISLDGPTQDLHDRIRGVKGTFKNIVKGLNLFKRLDKKPYLRIHMVLSRLNYKSLKSFVDFAIKYEINEIGGAMINPFNFVSPELIISKNEIQKIQSKIMDFINYANKSGINLAGIFNPIFPNEIERLKKLYNFQGINKKNITTCFGLWEWSSIRPNGDVSICCFTNKPILGNLNKYSFKEIWNSKKANKLRSLVKRTHLIDSVCKGCMLGQPILTWLIQNEEKFEKILNEITINSR
ncbi:MAG: radical SAM protein [Promethearchaeota archaeon]